ncbi:MAG: FixG Ig-like domain-containing protein, partial [Rhodospirillales bacterium]
ARTLLYAGLLAIDGGVMLTSLLTRSTTEVNVLHERTPLFVQMSDGSVRNGYAYKILNMVREDRTYVLKTEGLADATLEVVGGKSGASELEFQVEKDQVSTFGIFVNAPESTLLGRSTDVTFVLTEQGKSEKPIRSKTLFAGPEK